jgi:hypothetical protein
MHAGLRGGGRSPMGSVSDRRRINNREFFEFFDEKQASDGLTVIGRSKFHHDHSWLGAVLGRFLLLRKTGDRSVKTGV